MDPFDVVTLTAMMERTCDKLSAACSTREGIRPKSPTRKGEEPIKKTSTVYEVSGVGLYFFTESVSNSGRDQIRSSQPPVPPYFDRDLFGRLLRLG